MNRASGLEVLGSEVPNCFEVLHSYAFIVLGAAGEDFSIGRAVCRKGRVEPLGWLDRDRVEVGIEEDGGQRGVGAWPCQEEKWLRSGKFQGFSLEANVESLGFEEGDGGGVVGVRVYCVNSEVALKPSYR